MDDISLTNRAIITTIFGPRRPKTPSVIVTDETSTIEVCKAATSGTNSAVTISSIVASGATSRVQNGTSSQMILSIPVFSASHEGVLPVTEDIPSAPTFNNPLPAGTTTAPKEISNKCNEPLLKVSLGVLVASCVAAAWVGSTHLLKSTYRPIIIVSPHGSTLFLANNASLPTTIPEVYHYEASFLSTWLVTTWTTLFLPLYTLCKMVTGHMSPRLVPTELRDSALAFREKGFTLATFLSRCSVFCILWVATNYMYIHALRILDATDVMALFATNVSFVYLLSWVILHDQFVGLRIVAVILCNTGIALLAYMDGITRSPTLGGVVLAAAAAAGSAVYKVLFKRIFGDTTYAQVSLFFSLIGLLNIFLLWPVLLVLHFSGIEPIRWTLLPWTSLTGAGALSLGSVDAKRHYNNFISIVANLLGNFGPALTYEVFIHLGLVVSIPISASLDSTWHDVTFEGMKLAGTVLIVCGFLLVLFPENWPDYLTRLLRWGRQYHFHAQGGQAPTPAPVDQRTGYISRSHLRSPSGRVR